jgi:L-arabinokinase
VTPTFVFFISGHGFGHASRQVEIINAVTSGPDPVRVIVRSSADPALLARTLRRPYTLIAGPCDPGIVQRDSVTHDDDASIDAIRTFYDAFPAHVDAEVARLAADSVAAIVGDIPPLAFATAARLGVPSLAIANFTWDWIYEVMPGFTRRAPEALGVIREAYRLATQALALPLSSGFEIFPHRGTLPLVARHASLSRSATRRQLGLPLEGRVALLSFGGYGLPSLGVTAIDLDGWTIVTTDRTRAGADSRGPIVTIAETVFVDTPLRYEDLVAAADVVITKPGYGIIAECAANDTALVYTSRGAFREYDLLVEEMPRYVRCAFLSQDDLRAGRWRAAIESAAAAPRPPAVATDGAERAAEAIRALARVASS